MKEDGLVTTSTSAQDARVTEVSIADAGSPMLQRIKGCSLLMFGIAAATA